MLLLLIIAPLLLLFSTLFAREASSLLLYPFLFIYLFVSIIAMILHIRDKRRKRQQEDQDKQTNKQTALTLVGASVDVLALHHSKWIVLFDYPEEKRKEKKEKEKHKHIKWPHMSLSSQALGSVVPFVHLANNASEAIER